MKRLLSLLLSIIIMLTSFAVLGLTQTSAATYAKIPALPISRVYQPYYDENGLCYWSSMATVQGYCLGTYTYGGVTTNYRKAGTDYNYLDRADAITKMFKDSANGYANNANNLTKYYPVKMTRVTDGIGKNTATYQKIYNQLAQGKPVIVYTGTHASVVIAYNGSTTTLQPSGFTVMEIKKDKTSSGAYWWVNSATHYSNHANKPMIDSASLSTNEKSYMCCYVNLESWISYCGNKLQEICYPTNAVTTTSTFSFNANGGEGSMSTMTVKYGATINIPACSFTRDGYTFAGYNVYRVSDKTWYCNGSRWQTSQAIIDNNYEKKTYLPGESYGFSTEWVRDGGVIGGEFIFYPIWKPVSTTLDFYENSSGTNYMATINTDTYKDNYQSRNTGVYTVEAENSVLKIVGKSAGSVGSDLLFKTHTNKSPNYNFNAGDSKAMTLTFKAKSSVDGAKMYFRWGYTSDKQYVTLSTEWKEYTVDMSKQINDGAHIHPFFDKTGTFYISDIVMKDNGASDPTGEETGQLLYSKEYTVGTSYKNLPTPVRQGYVFKGWYTSKFGGTKITESTSVFEGHTAVYARWEKAESGILMGDVDLSGTINVKDATMIQKAVAGILALSVRQNFAANVITTDNLNVRDATAIQKWCAGMNTGEAVINVTVSYA